MRSCSEPADSQKLGKSPLRKVQQVNKAVAVVPPISQQASVHTQQNDMTTSAHDTVPMETDTVMCLSKQKETNVPNVTCKLTEDLPGVNRSASSSLRLGSAADMDIPETATYENVHTSGSQSCERGPASTAQITNQWQDSISIVNSTSESPAEQNHTQEVEIPSEKNKLNLSTIPGVEYTLSELKDLVNSFEIKSRRSHRSMRMNIIKCIIDLYFDGNQRNLSKLAAIIELAKPLSEFSVKEMPGVVLQYPEPEHIKIMKTYSQIITTETTISEDFTSSWLNVDRQPADVDTVLAESMSEYNTTWYTNAAQSVYESCVPGVDSLAQVGTDNAEDQGVPASKGIPKPTEVSIPDDTFTSVPENSLARHATTDCSSDTMGFRKDCVRRTPKKFSSIQRISNKQYHQKPEDEVAMATESMQELSEPSLMSTSDKCKTTNTDSPDDADSYDDFPDITVLSSEDIKKIFSEYSDDDQTRDQAHQEDRKDSVTLCVKSQSDSVHIKPLDDLKFTCPHVTDFDSGGVSLCPTCWNETPLLDIDGDETLLSPKKREITTDSQSQSCSPQSGKPIKHQSTSVQKRSSMINSETLHHSINKKCFVQLPAKTGLSTRFQLSNIQRKHKHKTAAPRKLKRPITEEDGPDLKSNEAKKVRLELYGSSNTNSDSGGEKKSYTTPVYLTVSPSPSTTKSLTGESSAKQKVHTQWRSTSIHRQKISSSTKKRQKSI